MSKGSIQLISPIIVTKITLLHQHSTPHTFQQKIFCYYANLTQTTFIISLLTSQQTQYGPLPLAIINDTHIIHPKQFIPFAQALYHPSPQLYVLQKAVISNCMRLVELNRVEQIENQSSYWLLWNPLKRLREYLSYKKQLKELEKKNISQDMMQNQLIITKTINQFQQLLSIQDQFSNIVQYLCLDFLFEHKNEISKKLRENTIIMERYKLSISEQKLKLQIPVIADIKGKQEEKKEDQEKENKEKGLEAVIKTLFVLSIVWIPWVMWRERMLEAELSMEK